MDVSSRDGQPTSYSLHFGHLRFSAIDSFYFKKNAVGMRGEAVLTCECKDNLQFSISSLPVSVTSSAMRGFFFYFLFPFSTVS